MTATPPTRRVHCWICGRVQGVFYRDSMRTEARRLGVRGWCRNLPDGRVEAVAQGDPEAIDALLSWCRQGPPAARVDEVDVHDEPVDTPEPPFEVRR